MNSYRNKKGVVTTPIHLTKHSFNQFSSFVPSLPSSSYAPNHLHFGGTLRHFLAPLRVVPVQIKEEHYYSWNLEA